ncbi:coiled-coil domain-containing glutamate-rich protein 2 isoform X2 [Thamnophis elegans]|uniref:coiled-coil domain-containing glutamate-rich protein 2 isoform X2 n=1 Tax=Thamnophis elegans TaxID=35005 RepID=UPI001376AD3B|nr:coiled-coil domain-containing glutamate-rich protein 2 isoform X2 [Thamnophis elegans]
MISPETSLLLFFLWPAFSLPVPTQLSKDDETVIKCISEILADTLSRSSPMPVTSDCMKVLREDDRVLTMLHHRHLLTELEGLAHQENTKHLLAHETNHNSREEKQQGELKKRGKPAQRKGAAPEEGEELAGEKKDVEEEEEEEEEEKEVTKKEEKSKNLKEEAEVSREEDLPDALKGRDEEEEEEEEEEGEIKKKASSETWHSKEYFGHVKERGSRPPKIRKEMREGDEERQETGKKRPRMDEEDGEDTSEEEEKKKYHPGGDNDEEKWEGEEEGRMAKRVAEKASDEETAQFEEEEQEKGLKSSKAKAHLHKGWKPWQEGAEEKNHHKVRHAHHHPSLDLDLKKRYEKDRVDLRGRHHTTPEEEEEEEEEEKVARQRKAPEVEKLEEIVRELKWAADQLEELKTG